MGRERQKPAKSCLLEPAEIDPKQSSLTIELTGLDSRSGRSGGMMGQPVKKYLPLIFLGLTKTKSGKILPRTYQTKARITILIANAIVVVAGLDVNPASDLGNWGSARSMYAL
jgi:hypothetical protein